jgi:F0F1-type ATP synthase membrane subunit a
LPFVPGIVIDKAHKQETPLFLEVSASALTDNQENAAAATESTAAESHGTVDFANCFKTKECMLSTSGVKYFEEPVHIFRAPTSDLSFTVSLALISVVVTNALGLKYLKLGYVKKFIYNPLKKPIDFIVGFLEIISEFSKILTFSFRLFGNIFAGELLLAVITFLTVGMLTLPFMALELFVGVIQAFVFLMLTTVFIKLAITGHDQH